MIAAARLDEDLDQLLDQAGDDQARLLLLAEYVAAYTEHLDYARQLRNATALRLRARGVPMLQIAAAAGVGDSYLSRHAIASGSPRRVNRRRDAAAS